MFSKKQLLIGPCAVLAISFAAAGDVKKPRGEQAKEVETTGNGSALLWRNPVDIASRNLYYGAGGKEHQPRSGTFTFVKEDLDGSNPKIDVKDADGVKWKIKLGTETRPETAASRLVWAAGYFAHEDYFLQDLRVEGLPAHLHRGQKLVAQDGSMHNARLKRGGHDQEDQKKIGIWKWRDDPLVGTRELNGLRVIMALINNWDLKDVNNAVYLSSERQDGSEKIYLVSDLGASFGPTRLALHPQASKGSLDAYSHSRFIHAISADSVDFEVPGRPSWVVLVNPRVYFTRLGVARIRKHVPRADAKWMGQLLAQLSPSQIRDAFRCAGYSPEEVEEFARVVERRIAELTEL